jgi:hypothetical protein
MTSSKQNFIPISINRYIESHLRSNPGTKQAEIELGLNAALEAHRNGTKCSCGNPIWVIGSAVAGTACFTCITGEAKPDDDYEIDEALCPPRTAR